MKKKKRNNTTLDIGDTVYIVVPLVASKSVEIVKLTVSKIEISKESTTYRDANGGIIDDYTPTLEEALKEAQDILSQI